MAVRSKSVDCRRAANQAPHRSIRVRVAGGAALEERAYNYSRNKQPFCEFASGRPSIEVSETTFISCAAKSRRRRPGFVEVTNFSSTLTFRVLLSSTASVFITILYGFEGRNWS